MVLVGPAHDLPHLQDEFYLVQPNLDLPSARIRERRSCSVSNFSIYKPILSRYKEYTLFPHLKTAFSLTFLELKYFAVFLSYRVNFDEFLFYIKSVLYDMRIEIVIFTNITFVLFLSFCRKNEIVLGQIFILCTVLIWCRSGLILGD